MSNALGMGEPTSMSDVVYQDHSRFSKLRLVLCLASTVKMDAAASRIVLDSTRIEAPEYLVVSCLLYGWPVRHSRCDTDELKSLGCCNERLNVGEGGIETKGAGVDI